VVAFAAAVENEAMKTIRDFMADPRPFIVETVIGPWLCRWTEVDGLPACVFVEPHSPSGHEPQPAPTSPRTPVLQPGAEAA
jgi:hypothetical protein